MNISQSSALSLLSAVQGPLLGNVPPTSKACLPLSVIFIKITPYRLRGLSGYNTDHHGQPWVSSGFHASVQACALMLKIIAWSGIEPPTYTGRHRGREARHFSGVRKTVLMRFKKFSNTVYIHQNMRIGGAFLCSCKTAAGASDLQARMASPILLSAREAESFAFWARAGWPVTVSKL